MKDGKLLIAGGVIGVTSTLFFAAYVANAVGQFRTTGTYEPPTSLIQLFQLLLGASVTILGWGSLRALNAPKRKIEDEESE